MEIGGRGLRMPNLGTVPIRIHIPGRVEFALCNLMVQCAPEQPCRHFCNLITLMPYDSVTVASSQCQSSVVHGRGPWCGWDARFS